MTWKSAMSRNTGAIDLSGTVVKQKPLNEHHQSVLDCMKDGWRLYQHHLDFTWYMKKVGEMPFGTITAVVFKVTSAASH